MGDEAVEKVAMLLEQLNSRFELVVEVAEGFSGKLQAMHEEMVSQISEVGKQIRFLSDQIGDNRTRLTAVRSDLATEMVRLNEALGATRVQIRETSRASPNSRASLAAAPATALCRPKSARKSASASARRGDGSPKSLTSGLSELRQEIGQGLAQAADQAQGGGAAAGAEGLAAEVRNEVKATHKALTGLAKKFERFDDKMSVQVKDHDQRLRKLERSARG